MDLIEINCGNKVFTISPDNLKKSEYFSALLLRWNKGPISVDQDPRVFRHFLNALRTPVYEIPNKYKKNVYALLDYYVVKYTKLSDESQTLFEAKSECLVCSEKYQYVYCTDRDSNMIAKSWDNYQRMQIENYYVYSNRIDSGMYIQDFAFNGKLIDINLNTSYIYELSIWYNGTCILKGINYYGKKGLKKGFKKYLDGLVGQFVIKICFDVRNIPLKHHHDVDTSISIGEKRSWCTIYYFDLV